MRINDTRIFWPHVKDFIPPIIQNKVFSINLKLIGNHCNMRCSYCYAHDEPLRQAKKLTPDLVSTLITRLPNTHRLRFILHGGEPLLYSKNRMKMLLETISDYAPDRHEVRIQSNGTLLDDEWIDLFLQYCPNIVCSLSLDSLNMDGLRRLPNGELYIVMREKLALLRRRGVQVGIVATASQLNRDGFPAFIDELISYGVRYLTINRLRLNSGLRSGSNTWGLSEDEFVNVLDNVLHHWIINHLFKHIQIQPLMSLFIGDNSRLCTFADLPEVCSSFLSLYPDGHVTICDHFGSEGRQVLDACENCQIRSWCGSGCYGEKKNATFCQARFRLKSIIEQALL